MSDLQPYHQQRRAPLTAGARFIRGFTRIGVVVAVLVTLIGVPASFNYDYAAKTYESAQCIARLARALALHWLHTRLESCVSCDTPGPF